MMQDWSFLEIGGGEVITCGKNGVTKAGRDFINGLFARIEELSKENAELRANKHLNYFPISSPPAANECDMALIDGKIVNTTTQNTIQQRMLGDIGIPQPALKSTKTSNDT